jgi:RNA polymerase sigma-70 factor (ECF subfamily)
VAPERCETEAVARSIAALGEDDDIGAALRRGDDGAAFALLMRRYGGTVFDRCFDVLRDKGLAEDATQNTMIKTLRARAKLAAVQNLRAWLLQVATNTALDTLRAAKRQNTRIERLRQHGGADEAVVSPGGSDEHGRYHAALQICLEELDPDTRAAFLRRHKDEASWDEIAEELGLPVDTVRMRVKRALKGLKRCLERQDIER